MESREVTVQNVQLTETQLDKIQLLEVHVHICHSSVASLSGVCLYF